MDVDQIRAILHQYLAAHGIYPVSGDQDLFDTGVANSLFAIQLVTYLEQRFEFKITTADLEFVHFRSVDNLVSFVVRRLGGIS